MKKLLPVALLLCLPMLSACSEESESPVCDASYLPHCNATNTAIVACQQNPTSKNFQLIETRCDYGCDAALNQCKAKPEDITGKCTDTTHPKTCKSDKSGYTWCENGEVKTAACNADQICDTATVTCVPKQNNPTESCTDEKNPATCNGAVLSFCNNGTMTTVTCGGSTTCDAASKSCKPKEGEDQPIQSECDPKTYAATCLTPHKLQKCVDGKIVTETCSAGMICNGAIKNKSCKRPAKGDVCDPETFAESCTDADKGAIICDEETRKVTTVDCTKEYGDKYRCDIAEDFNGAGLDLTMCYNPNDAQMNCKSADDSYTVCEYDAKEDAHFTTTYQCAKFNLGFHYYVADIEECPRPGACNADKTACKGK